VAGSSVLAQGKAVSFLVEYLGLSFSLSFETSSHQSKQIIHETYFASLFIVRRLYSILKYKIELNP
jgi:hypothetical protein